MTTRKLVNRRIEKLRNDLNLTQEEFGVKLGMEPGKKTRSAVNNWEQGEVQIKSDILAEIASTFNVSSDWLLGLTNNKTNDTTTRAVCEYTGLSEKTVNLLQIMAESVKKDAARSGKTNQATIKMIDLIFDNSFEVFGLDYPYIETLLTDMYRYIHSCDTELFTEPIRSVKLPSGSKLMPEDYEEIARAYGISKKGLFVRIRDVTEKVSIAQFAAASLMETITNKLGTYRKNVEEEKKNG